MADEDHKFDRRHSDAVVSALSTRVGLLEGRVEVIEHEIASANRGITTATAEVKANTRLCEEIQGRAEEIYGVATELQTLLREKGAAAALGELAAFTNDMQAVWRVCKKARAALIETAKWGAAGGVILAALTAPSWGEAVVRIAKPLFGF